MSGAAIFNKPRARVQFCEEQAGEGHKRFQQADVTVNARNDGLRLGSHSHARAHQPHQMRGPHPGRQTFATDITQRKYYAVALLFNCEKVTGQVANGKNLAGNFKVSETNVTRGAQTPVHLRSLENLCMQFSVILLKVCKPDLQLLTSYPDRTLRSRRVNGGLNDIDCPSCS